jgi:hypothetical protein
MPRLASFTATFVLLTCLHAAPARAEGSRVVVLTPVGAAPAVQRAVRRTQAELRAAGFVVLVEDAPIGDVRRALSTAATKADAVAAIAIVPDQAGAAADVWVADRLSDKTLIRTVRVASVPSAERPRALAIRAVELLRASFVEVLVSPEPDPAQELPTDVRAWLQPPRGALQGVTLQLGVGMITSFDGVGPAGAPSVRLGWADASGLGARVSWLGPAYGARLTDPRGNVSVRQELVTADLIYAPAVAWSGWVPLVWLGAGAYHLHADGELLAPLVGRSADVWTAAFVGGAGLGYRLTPRVTALLDATAVVTAPRAVVTLFGEPLGRAGRPSLVADLGVAVRF